MEMACLALAECRLKGFKQHVQARDRSAAHTSRTKTRPSRCLNGAAAADDQVLQQRSSGSSTRQVQGMPAGSPSCRFQGEDGEPRRTSARHQAVATVVVVGAVSTRQPQCTPVRRIFSGGVWCGSNSNPPPCGSPHNTLHINHYRPFRMPSPHTPSPTITRHARSPCE